MSGGKSADCVAHSPKTASPDARRAGSTATIKTKTTTQEDAAVREGKKPQTGESEQPELVVRATLGPALEPSCEIEIETSSSQVGGGGGGPVSVVLPDESQRQGEAVIGGRGETSKSSSIKNDNNGEGASAVAAGTGGDLVTSGNGRQARALGFSDLAVPSSVDGGDPPAQTGDASVSCLVARGAVVAGLLPSALPSALGDAVPFLSIVVSAPRLVAWGGLGSG